MGDPLVSCPHCSERHPFNEVGGHYVTCVSGKGWKMGRCENPVVIVVFIYLIIQI